MLTEGVVQRGRDPGIRVSLGRLSSGSWCFLIETVSSVQGRGSEGAGRPVAAVTAALQAGPGTGPGAHSSESSGSRLVPQTAVRGAAHLPVESLVHFPRRVCLWALRGRGGCHAEWGLGCSLRSSCLHYLLIEINSEKLQYITNNLFPEPFERKSLTRFLFFFATFVAPGAGAPVSISRPMAWGGAAAVMLAPGAAADTDETSRARRSPAAVPPGS